MNPNSYRALWVTLTLTVLAAAAWSRAAERWNSACRYAPPASAGMVGSAPVVAAPADPPLATSVPLAAVPAPAPLAEDKNNSKIEEKEPGKEKQKNPGSAGDAGGDEDAAEDKPEADDEEVAGAAIDRLRAFFPETIGEFRRTNFRQYDPAGEDASVGYNRFRKGRIPWVTFTAYFYPARGDSLDEDLEAAVRDVTSQHEEAEVGKPEVVEVTRHGKTVKGRRVRFKFTHAFGDKEEPLASELYLFPGAPGRLVKYRITFPAADAGTLQKTVDKFAESFPWPPGL